MPKDTCFLITKPQQGGGNALATQKIIVRRNAAIGDALAATVVANRLDEKGYDCEFQTHINIHCLLRYCPSIAGLAVPGGYAHCDLDGAYEQNPARRNLHFSEMFMGKADESLRHYGITIGAALNCRAAIILPNEIKQLAAAKFNSFPRPWIFFCPRSNTYNVRQVPDPLWETLAQKIHGTKFWLGTHPAPSGIVDLQARHLDNVIAWLSAADMMVSVDTGPAHIAIAQGIQTVMLGQSSSPDLHFSDQRDFETVWPDGLTCLNCQQNVCPVNQYLPPCQTFNPEKVAIKIRQKLSFNVSAAIAIYQPETGVLNRCLECLLPQVEEIIVCVDQAGRIPAGALQDQKIRYINHPKFNVGYGRKMNMATRHTNGRYVLQVNDDVFLNPGAVERMLECMKPGVGITSCLLRYPNGTIQHAGKVRTPGRRGWDHINHKQHLPDFKEPVEQENTCGACWMVDRKAHFETGGFDERFFIYAEDDDYCLRMRRAGYKIMFTPHASGTHLEHQSTTKTGPILEHLRNSNTLFGQLWGDYFNHNANRIPGNFDYLKT